MNGKYVANEKKIAVWGAGANGRHFLERYGDSVSVVIDNNCEKDGTMIQGVPVVHSSKITDIQSFFIIIAVAESEAIEKQLLALGLRRWEDFVRDYEYSSRTVTIDSAVEALQYACFGEDENVAEIEKEFTTRAEYYNILEENKAYIRYENALDKLYRQVEGKAGGYPGYCVACGEQVHMQLNYHFEYNGKPIWRESATCPKCGCNSRMRYMIDRVIRQGTDKQVYLYERVTSTYRALDKILINLTGSEYLGNNIEGGTIIDGVMHQDAMQLSFADESFDVMVSNDVFEHVADFHKAFSEAWRCLKPGGKLIFSVPICTIITDTVTRARMDAEGNVEYLMEPAYHENPISKKGSLVFHDFSFDIVEHLKNAGFRDAYFACYASAWKGYFGFMPMIIEACK